MCEDLNKIAGRGIYYDIFEIQNTKWLWLVSKMFTALNSNKILCGCFGLYPSFVAGILNTAKRTNFFVLCNGELNYFIIYIIYIYNKYIIYIIYIYTINILYILYIYTINILYILYYIGKCCGDKDCSVSYKSDSGQLFQISYQGESISIYFEARLLPKLPSKSMFGRSVLK